MKKILCILFVLISMNVFSQKIISEQGSYDSNNTPYIKTTIVNNTWKDIVCIVFTVEYNFPSLYDVNRFKEVTVQTYIESGVTKTISYYPVRNYYRPLRQKLFRVIFSDGSYKNFY